MFDLLESGSIVMSWERTSEEEKESISLAGIIIGHGGKARHGKPQFHSDGGRKSFGCGHVLIIMVLWCTGKGGLRGVLIVIVVACIHTR
jgi:hypothetical protein